MGESVNELGDIITALVFITLMLVTFARALGMLLINL